MQTFRSVRWISLVIAALLSAGAEAGASRLHVRAGASPIGADGLSWATAFPSLQAALDIARAAPQDVSEIWVARGVYKPTIPYTGPGQGDPADPRSRAFLTAGPNIPVYGGFKGDETTLPPIAQRRYPTILSGDHAGDDNFAALAGTANTADNSYHVVRVTNGGCWFNGVTIRSGVASSLTNSFDRNGGGLRSTNFNMDVVRLEHCRVTYNFATDDGGGLYNNANAHLEGCVFDRNRTNASGGGIRHFGSSLVVVNSVFRQNQANSLSAGGGAALVTTFSTFTNCTLIENNSIGAGGALRAGTGGTLRIANSLLWNNSSPPVSGASALTNVWVQGVNPNPRLLDTSGPDAMHFTDDDYPFGMVAIDSPILDAGANGADIDQSSGSVQPLPTTDARGLPRFDASSGLVDIGAYELQSLGEPVYRQALGEPVDFGIPAAWVGGVAPTGNHAAVLDRPNFVLFPAGATVSQRALVTDIVSFDFASGAQYALSGGGVEPEDAGLRIDEQGWLFMVGSDINNLLSADAATLGWSGGGRLTFADGARGDISSVIAAGEEEFPATIDLGTTGKLTTSAMLSLGALSDSDASMLLSADGQYEALGPGSVRVGDQGRGQIYSGAASLVVLGGPGTSVDVCIGCESGSEGEFILDGGAVLAVADSFRIGERGEGSFLALDGAALIEADPVEVASETGSIGLVEIEAPAEFRVSGELRVGAPGGGDATVRLSDGLLAAEVTRLAPGGWLTGQGTIEGDLFNGGRLTPRDFQSQSPFGIIDLLGDFEQRRDPAESAELSGRLEMNIGAVPGDHDQLIISGVATLGGGLYLTTPFGSPPPGATFSLIEASERSGVFDVVSSPVFQDRYFMRILYRDGAQRGAFGPIVDIVLDALDVLADFDSEQTVDLQTTDGEPLAGATADFNGDGFIDLAVIIPALAPQDPGCVLVLINAGVDGMGEWVGFQEFASCVSVGLDPRAIVAVNADGDLDTDVAVANFGSGSVTVLRNNGVGDFAASPPLTLPAPGAPVDIAAADMDLDGGPDLIVASAMVDAILVYHSDGVGGFGPAQLAPIGASPTAIVVDRLVPGGGPDVAIASASAGGVIVLSNDGARSLMGAAFIPLGGGDPDDIDSGDLDNDKDIDIVASATQPEPGNPEAGVVAVIIADSDEPNGFRPPALLAIGDSPRAVTVAQLDNAGGPDIAVIAEVADDAAVQLLINTTLPGGSASFSEPSTLSTSGSPRFLLSADVDNDSDEDLVTLNGTEPMEARGAADISTLLNELTIAVPGDVNFDGVVDFADLNIILSAFNSDGFGSPADVNDDGFVGFADLNFVLSNFNSR